MSARTDKNAKPHLSHSQLSMLGRCELQWYYRYVEKLRRPPGVAAVVGKGAHKPIEMDLKAKIETGALLPDEQIADIAADATRTNWAGDDPVLSGEDRARGRAAVLGDAVDQAVALAQLHHRELAPKIEPVAVERPFRIELRGFPYDIVGYWDVEEPTGLRDTKTRGRAPSEGAAARSLQMAIYSMARTVIRGAPPDFVAIDHLVKRRKEPEVITQVAHPGPAEHDQVLHRVEVAAKVIERGVFAPTDPDNWWCSNRWCGYYEETCPFGARGRTRP